MRIPKLKRIKRYADIKNRFGGYVHTAAAEENEFYDMENLTSDSFPLLCVRPERAVWKSAVRDESGHITDFQGTMLLTGLTAAVNASDKLCYCSKTSLYINGKPVENCDLDTDVTRRSIVPVGRNIFIAPDGILVEEDGDAYKVTKAQNMPLLDFAVEHNNRIWGCRFGDDGKGHFVNEIYASASGDPLTWDKFDGISTDSYRVNSGSAGEFTGIAVLGNDVLFFKENYIIKISGSAPYDFTAMTIPARGVEKGAERSIVNLNEKIFYKSRGGILVFDGALPYSISEDLGDSIFTDAAAGTVKGKYYIALTDENNKRNIYVFDTHKGMWHKENASDIRYMVTIKNCLFSINCVTKAGSELFPVNFYSLQVLDLSTMPVPYNVFSGAETEPFRFGEEECVEWFALTGINGAAENETRILRNMILRLKTDDNTEFRLFAVTDKGEKLLYSHDGAYEGTVNIPVCMPREDSFRLKYEGKGRCMIFSAALIYEKTNEVNIFGR